MRVVLFALAGLSVAGQVSAQATHVVGPGGHPDIDSAIAAASAGDVIRVLPGTYPVFLLTKGVTIRSDPPGSAAVTGFLPSIAQVPAGETGHLVGMQLNGLAVSGCQMTLDECVFFRNALSMTNGSVVVVQGCTMWGSVYPVNGGPMVVATQSELTMIDTTVVGQPMAFGSFSPAVTLTGSRLRGSSLQVLGGAGLPVPAIAGDFASWAWLSDCTVTGLSACPITVPNGRHDRCVLTPNCSMLPAGFVLGVHRLQPMQNGTSFTVEFRAAPGMVVGSFFAPEFRRTVLAELEQSLLLPAAVAFPGGAYIANGQGVATATWTVPAGPLVVDQVLWVQAFAGLVFPLQASALCGGVVR